MNDTRPLLVEAGTLLFVEDNEVYRQVVSAALKRRFPHWGILPAASLAEAAETARSEKLDLVITDLSLPDGSGVELLPHLAKSQHKDLRIIALTNDSSDEVLVGLKRLGYHGFVAKEHGIKSLCEAIEVVMGGKEYVSQASRE